MKLPTAELSNDFIIADADYFETKAHQCYRLANYAGDDAAKVTLVSLASVYEEKAWKLREEE